MVETIWTVLAMIGAATLICTGIVSILVVREISNNIADHDGEPPYP
jgi:hypothetical protein